MDKRLGFLYVSPSGYLLIHFGHLTHVSQFLCSAENWHPHSDQKLGDVSLLKDGLWCSTATSGAVRKHWFIVPPTELAFPLGSELRG